LTEREPLIAWCTVTWSPVCRIATNRLAPASQPQTLETVILQMSSRFYSIIFQFIT